MVPKLFRNIIGVSALQGANNLIPILMIPYLIWKMGIESYGNVALVQSVIQFLLMVVDFGFSLSATRDIAANNLKKNVISNIFSTAWVIQWIIFFSLVFMGIGIAFFSQSLIINYDLYLVGIGIIVGQLIFPTWLLYGCGKVIDILLAQLIGKILVLPILFFVNGDNALLAMTYFSTSSLVAGMFLYVKFKRSPIFDFQRPTFAALRKLFISELPIFLSTFFISLYTLLLPICVGFWSGPIQLTYFNIANKIRLAVQMLINPVGTVLFPTMSHLYATDHLAATKLLIRASWVLCTTSFLLGSIIWLWADKLMIYMGGMESINGVSSLKWLAFVPLLVTVSNLIGVQIMIPLGMNKPFSMILGAGSLLCTLLAYHFISSSGAEGAAKLTFLVEGLIAVLMYGYINFTKPSSTTNTS